MQVVQCNPISPQPVSQWEALCGAGFGGSLHNCPPGLGKTSLSTFFFYLHTQKHTQEKKEKECVCIYLSIFI